MDLGPCVIKRYDFSIIILFSSIFSSIMIVMPPKLDCCILSEGVVYHMSSSSSPLHEGVSLRGGQIQLRGQ